MALELWRLDFVNAVKPTIERVEGLYDLQALEKGGLKALVCDT